ncbi:MAG: glycoside hydrolase family 15 [Paenibacillaceae bacterium]|jgi:phosphorylase kinase alpha/beta subunit|nr:glycoside hydrolase family 15 [Paenibacillaceae bacterium]
MVIMMAMSKFHLVLERMRLPNGTYVASLSKDYDYVWIRDVCYTVLAYLTSSCNRYEKAYHALFDLFRRYEWKIDIHRNQKPVYPYEYIHARYSKDLKEIKTEWGHAQNDAIGAFLFGVGEGVRLGKKVIRDRTDRGIVQKLVDYLACIEYWQDEDNGMWEENREVHASSVGACVAGLKAVKMLVNVPESLIAQGEETLNRLLPRESATKDTDLSLLSLVYPYQVVTREMAGVILERVTSRLERTYGCIRYANDQYYNEGSEAEWCFGFPWLGLCYSRMGDTERMMDYWGKTQRVILPNGDVPELYVGGKQIPNGNTPLAWSVSMTSLLYERVQKLNCALSS